jgi:ABC-type nitrate/sulfonate/bicarbonate transport system substrate-binding protein
LPPSDADTQKCWGSALSSAELTLHDESKDQSVVQMTGAARVHMRHKWRKHGSRHILTRSAMLLTLYVYSVQSASTHGTPLRYAQAYSALQSIFALPVLVAERNGYFVHEGLDFSMLPVPGGGERLIQALHDGRADICHVATPFLIQAVLGGSDAVAIAAEFNNPVYTLLAKPAIRSYADLKGKLLGLAAENGSITLSIRKLLALHGLGRADFRSKFVDGTPERLACLIAGDCDAAPLGQPQDFYAIRHGYKPLGLSTEAVPEYVYTVTAARPAWAEAHKDTVVRYVRALSSAFKFIRDPTRRIEVLKAIADTTAFDEGNAQLTLGLYLEPDSGVIPKLGEINLPGMEQVIALMGEGGILKPPLPSAQQFVDLQYLQAAKIQ